MYFFEIHMFLSSVFYRLFFFRGPNIVIPILINFISSLSTLTKNWAVYCVVVIAMLLFISILN